MGSVVEGALQRFPQSFALRAAVLFVGILVACGCGGAVGEDDARSADPTPNWKRPNGLVYVTPGLNKGRFVAHLNEYCRRSWEVIRKRSGGSYFTLIGAYLYGEIQDFGTAPGERGTVEHLLVELKGGVRHGERMPTAEPTRIESLFAGYNMAARRLGLDECLVAHAHLPKRSQSVPK